MNTKFQQLAKLFQRLPGVGPRQAARFVIALLDRPEEDLIEFGTAINSLKRNISFCGECFNISDPVPSLSAVGWTKSTFGETKSADRLSRQERDKGRAWGGANNSICHICHDQKRDQAKIMIVEKVTDLESIEKTGLYKGLYHVLGGAINPLDKIMPTNLKIKELEKRLEKLVQNPTARSQASGSGVEIILATNPNTPGETTALYLRDLLTNKKGVSITRLGRGLSSGSHLEYADETTLKHALEYRQ